MDTIDRIRSIPRYITIAAWIAAAAIALYLISMVKRFVAPNANLIPKGCCTCREEPRLTQETPPTYISYVPQQPGPLTRSASHVSLVVAAEPTIVAPSRSDEGTFKLSTFNTTKNPRRTLPTSTLPEYLPGNSDGSLNNRTKY